jgi:hypothetical protein
MRDLTFLLEPRILTTRELEDIFKEVLFLLRINRRKNILPLEQVEMGNGFILTVFALSQIDPSMDLEIPPEDITYIFEENALLHMGPMRN